MLDPYEELRRRNPMPVVHQATRESDPVMAAMHARIISADIGPSGRRRRVLVAAVAVIAVAACLGASWLLVRSATDPLVVTCYRQANLSADRVVVAADGRGPIELCSSPWVDGPFSSPGHLVPPLVACVEERGWVWVFPGSIESTCAALGLKNNGPTPPNSSGAIEAQKRLAALFLTDCLPPTESRTAIAAVLHELGLEDWTIHAPASLSPDRPCTSVSISPAERSVSIVPVPNQHP